MDIQERISLVIKYSQYSPSAFANAIKFNQSNLSKILNGKRDVNGNLIDAICNKYPEIYRLNLHAPEVPTLHYSSPATFVVTYNHLPPLDCFGNGW